MQVKSLAIWLRRAGLLVLLVGSAHCSPGYTEVELILNNYPLDTKHLWFERTPQGSSHRSQFFVNSDQVRDRVRLRLIGELDNSETVRVRALDGSYCRLAAGEVALTAGQTTADVDLEDQREMACVLRVSSTGSGNVRVPDCLTGVPSGPASVDYHLRSGLLDPLCSQGLQLRAEPAADSLFAGWSQACFGGGSCDPWSAAEASAGAAESGPAAQLLADGLTQVHATFAPRQDRTRSGFCWVNPTPHGFILTGVWGSAPNDLWAVGDGGTVMRYNGTAWIALRPQEVWGSDRSVSTAPLLGIWGSSRSDIWMVGGSGNIVHWDGQSFTVSSLPGTTALAAVWGAGPGEVYVAGNEGAAWRCSAPTRCTQLKVNAPTSLVGVYFSGVWGRSATEVYLVGSRLLSSGGNSLHPAFEGVVMRSDGVSLTQVYAAQSETAPTLQFRTISGRASGPAELWIGASDGSLHTGDGQNFFVAAQTTAGQINALTTTGPVSANEPLDLWAATAGGQLLHRTGTPLRWEQIATPSYEPLYGLFGDTVNLWAVGAAGAIVQWNGAQAVAVTSGKRSSTNGRWIDSSGELWLTWEDKTTTRTAQRTSLGLNQPQNEVLYGLVGFGDTLFASATGRILSRQPTGWSAPPPVPGLENAVLIALGGVAADDLWAAGFYGSLLHSTSGGAKPYSVRDQAATLIQLQLDNQRKPESFDLLVITTPLDAVREAQKTALLQAVWAGSPNRMFAVGEAGMIVTWDGSALSTQLIPFADRLPTYYAVWGSSTTDVWVAGTRGALLHYDGTTWKACAGQKCPADPASGIHFLDITGTGPDDVWFAASCGSQACSSLYHWDGTQFCHVPDLPSSLGWVATRGSELYVVGTEGSILHLGEAERKSLPCIP